MTAILNKQQLADDLKSSLFSAVRVLTKAFQNNRKLHKTLL